MEYTRGGQPPNIDHPLETALELVEMIGNVGCKIGKLTVLPLYDPVFFIAEIRRFEPFRTILLVHIIALFEEINRAGHASAIEQGLLGKPDVENSPKFHQVIAAISQLLAQNKIMNVRVVLTQQFFCVGDKRIEPCLNVRFGASPSKSNSG